jgi:hypothetical protein
MTWLDRATATVGLLFGIAMTAPAALLILSPAFGIDVAGLKPHWIPYLLYGLATLGLVQIIVAVTSIRWAGRGK